MQINHPKQAPCPSKHGPLALWYTYTCPKIPRGGDGGVYRQKAYQSWCHHPPAHSVPPRPLASKPCLDLTLHSLFGLRCFGSFEKLHFVIRLKLHVGRCVLFVCCFGFSRQGCWVCNSIGSPGTHFVVPGWPQTPRSACSASQVRGLKACATVLVDMGS